MFNLKVKAGGNAPLLLNGKVNGESSFKDLKSRLFELTSIPDFKQKILTGFPPHLLTGSNEDKLKSLGVQNGELIIVEEVAVNAQLAMETNKASTARASNMSSAFPRGTLIKNVVPSDNSCLFASIYYLLNGGEIVREELSNLRQIVADFIKQNSSIYNEALLEKPNEEYCKWILKNTSWGGAIELAVLSDYYEIEIVAIDAKCGLVNRFGEDKKFDNRIFLMYDGIHYDPLHLESLDSNIYFIFPSTESWLLDQAYDIAQDAKSSGQFTDTEKFKLKCKQCGFLMKGETETIKHAKETGHTSFDEVKSPIHR